MEIKGYKVFNSDWTCRGKQYTCPGEFEEDVDLEICERGMHFCEKLKDCFNYYGFSSQNKVAEVVAYGNVKRDSDNDTKICTDKLRIVRELSWAEVSELVNTECDNTGISNTGSHNTGNYNTGKWNTGSSNTGNYNTGYQNTGDRNAGDYNTGKWNSGDLNSGHCNSGDWNTGNWNSGKYNSGHYNSGKYNSGHYNSGNCNSGDWNSGNYNTGRRNTGGWNSGNYNTGVFCSDSEKRIKMFNKVSSWSFEDFYASKAFRVMNSFRPTSWISFVDMTEEEKKNHPESKTTGGYLKRSNVQEWWNNLPEEDRKEVMSLPNFDAEIFRECTGIMIEDRDRV